MGYSSRLLPVLSPQGDEGRVVYKIEIVDGKDTHKVYVDAITGKVHTIK